MYRWINVIIFISVGVLLSACSNNVEQTEATQLPEIAPTIKSTSLPEATVQPTSMPDVTIFHLPERSGPRTQTTGSVPHIQIGVETIPAVNEELIRRSFSLPGVVNRPTQTSLPGALGMWLADDVELAHPEAIVSGREFSHIHPDGSLHAPLPYERALEAVEKGWAERHPWADDRAGWDGFVMLFTPQSMEELDITFQLIVESYNHVTGQTIRASDYE